jgi:homoserine O-acetyltransferase/O-succinyltransferase
MSVSVATKYEITGPAGAPVIIALGGISAGRHVAATPANSAPGWWEGVAGPGRAIDTRRFRVLGIDFLDGGRADNGTPARIVTTHDQADAIAGILDDLGVTAAHAVIGASYGGMVALAFAERYGARLERLVVLGAAHEADPNATAIRVIQRATVELGLETGRAHEALVLARGLAMTTYRGERELSDRFNVNAEGAPDVDGANVSFPVGRYLRHAGERFAREFAPERFLALSLSADLHRVRPELVSVPTTIVAFEGDRVAPRRQTLALAARLGTQLSNIAHVDIRTQYGHDGFLLEVDLVSAAISSALEHTVVEEPERRFPTYTITQTIRSTTCLA